MRCAVADMAREPRPAPTQWHYALANAANRLEAVRIFRTDYALGGEDRHIGGPYCLDCLVREGKLVDSSMAPSDAHTDVRPIPYGSLEPLDWSDPHALYKEVAIGG